MPQTVRVNIRSVANTRAVRKEKRAGRDVVIVPAATLPDNIVMNGIRYPADEIAKSYKGLNRTPAPLGHPKVNGKYVSARDPEGLAIGWIGAWNENATRKDGRVFLDKVIDVQIANQSEGGKAVLAAIDKGEPIHTSTGCLVNLENAKDDPEAKHIARNIEFDHDAILLDEPGAATPDQGVGMLVNAKGENEEITVINSCTDAIDHDIDWAGTRLLEAVRRKKDATDWQKIKTAILKALGLSDRETSNNAKEQDMSAEDIKALSEQVKTLSDSVTKMAGDIGTAVGTAVTNAVKPLLDAQNQIVANQKAKDEAEKTELVEKVVKANVLDEATAKATPLETLRALVKKPDGKAAPIVGAFNGQQKPAFALPKAEG
jgi:hypothetical protein